MRRLIEGGAVPGRNFVQVGLRGYWPERPDLEWMEEREMRTRSARDGLINTMNSLRQLI